MKNGKILFIVLISLVSLLCLSVVSAADNDVSDVIADTNDDTVLDESINDVDLGDSEIDELKESDGIVLDSVDETALKDDSSPGTFTDLNNDINGNDYSEINLTRDYKYVDSDSNYKSGIDIARSVTINGNGHTLDGSNAARMFQINGWAVIHFKNINFINGHSPDWGGAIFADHIWDIYAENCTFINNNAIQGGALHFIYATDCIFINNSATYCGAMDQAIATNCTFINNSADVASAIFGGAIILCNLENNDIYNTKVIVPNLTVSDFTSTYHSGEKLLFNLSADFKYYDVIKNIRVEGFNTTIQIYNQDEQLVGTFYELTVKDGGWIVDLPVGTYKAVLSIADLEEVGTAEATIIVEPANSSVSADDATFAYGDAISIPVTSENATNVDYEILDANGTSVKTGTIGPNEAISDLDLSIGKYTVKLTTVVNGNYIPTSTSSKLTIKKDSAVLSAPAVTTTYHVNKNLVITLKDGHGNPLSGVQITVNFGNNKKYTTDKKGQVKIAVGSLVPKTYTVKISYAGNNYYGATSTTAKVVVKKATPKLTAKAKTFKFEDKTKKYTTALKDNKGKALKNKKVSLKVNGKTYTAKTNSKGVATFKLSKLTKEGAYNAVIK